MHSSGNNNNNNKRHNNHHHRQNSAKTGEKWWEIDVTWYHVWLLRQLGVVTAVKVAQ